MVHAVIPTQRLHAPARAFVETLAVGSVLGATRVSYSRMVELELAETATQLALRERHGRRWRRFRADRRSRPRAARVMREALAAWAELVRATGAEPVEVDQMIRCAPSLMTQYGLQSYDALHVASALAVGADAIVTTDIGFAAVPAETAQLFVDTSRVAPCRARRAR